jgi:Tfp pilus assembly protein PilF
VQAPIARAVSVVAAALVLSAAANAAAGAPVWVELKTPAFTVVSDAGEKDARYVARQFDQVRALLKEVWPWARLDPSRPITILAARDENGIRLLLPEYWERKGAARPAGVFVKAPDRSWVVVRSDVARLRAADSEEDNAFLVVFHEYVHLVLHLNFSALPAWLDEGLADFWGNTIVDDEHVDIGRFIRYHLATLQGTGLLPLERLLAIDRSSREYSENNRATLFYAESWALVHYLAFGIETPAGQLSLLNRFVNLLKAGKPPADAQREAFGDLAALQKGFESYVGRYRFRYRRKPLALTAADQKWTTRALTAGESLALRAGLHAATGRPNEASRLAGEALALDAANAAAHEALAVVAVRQGKEDDALASFARAVELRDASDFAHYSYGRLLWGRASDDATLEKVEQAFLRAAELNTSYADAYDALASVMAARGAPLSKTLPLAVRAAQLEPSDIDHIITALRLAARGGQAAEVRRRAEGLLSNATAEDRRKLEALLKELPATVAARP